MDCPRCGLDIGEKHASSCPHCGMPLDAASAPSSHEEDALPPQPTFQFQPQFSAPATPRLQQPGSAYPTGKTRKTRRVLLSLLSTTLIIGFCIGCPFAVLYVQAAHNANLATATPLPQTTPGAAILFQDPLTNDTRGWADTNGNCFFQDNAYHIKDNYVCYAPAGIISDANITVQARQLTGSLLEPYGMIFRQTSTGNWYAFFINSNSQWAFDKVVNGTDNALVPFTANAAIKGGLNTVNTLLVQAKGAHFVFFVNGAQVGEADDSTFASGQSGLAAGGEGAEVAFNNFQITAAT